jgi:hypothetical protein
MNEPCLFCGQHGCAEHHATGRDEDGTYLDPDLRGRLCEKTCHPLVHDDWNTAGVRDRVTPATFLDSLLLRLRRTALFLGRLAPNIPGPLGELLARLAEALAVWAASLATALAALDATFPTWRTTPGV